VLDGLDNPIAPGWSRQRALPRGRHHRRRHRHQPLSDPDLQPEGRRALHHARHRGVEGSRNRRAGHRALPLPHLGKDTFSFSAQPFHRFGKNLAKCQKMGVTPKAALIIGVDPILAYTCQVQVTTRPTTGRSQAGCAASRSSSTKCKTCDIEVPATAEVVIEFEVDMAKTVMEGPLGEYTGYYTPASLKPWRASPPSRTARSRCSRACSPASRSRETISSSRFRSRPRSSRR
jgi:hypothetical protein